MTGGVREDLRSLPWPVAAGLVVLAVVVLVLRLTGLMVALIVDTAERLDVAAATAARIAPLAASIWIRAADLAVPRDMTRGGDDR
ncbi:hypothetical protein [Frankia sp. KB5]|uniref:hypothetical protein n=1 Tax=Frankia sp. KB5 TaxID=683318 RepID=UPI000A118635|nr:hypothetical protein [Frankia sp. KB5]ORT46983.1 hypothetical protein KBI5_22245 [Frankia sp. KB5]